MTKLETESAKFPLLFARALTFGRGQLDVIKNGTATLVNFGSGAIAITCHHNLDGYRKLLSEARQDAFFRIANVDLDPFSQLIDQDPSCDLATIRLSQRQAEELRADGCGPEASIFEPKSWPSPLVEKGESVALGGFPGDLRELISPHWLRRNSFSIGATSVSSVTNHQFACQFERHLWVWASKRHSLEDAQQHARELGGLSGGPVFALRGFSYDFVGIIYEFSSNLDILFAKHASLIGADGTIRSHHL
jgi:hypothetical protein